MIAIIRLLRPINCLVMGAGVLVGAVLAHGEVDIIRKLGQRAWMAFGAVAAVGAGANAINDYFDVKADKINRPDRPLAAELLPRDAGFVAWCVLSVVGVAMSFTLSVLHGVISLAVVWLMFVYSSSLKSRTTYANLIVALAVGLVVLFGGLLVSLSAPVAIGVTFAFAVTLAREIAKDIEDVDGDLQSGTRTIATVRGSTAARRVVLFVSLATVLALPVPYWSHSFNGLYLVGVFLCGFLMLAATWTIMVSVGKKGVHAGSLLLKITMLLGMLSLSLAQVQWT